MRRIRLTRGRYATVDDRFHDVLAGMGSWYFDGRYAATTSPRPSKRKLYMHRVVAELSGIDISLSVDHRRSQQTLNNQVSNLRAATLNQQQHNRRRQRNNTSGYRGVTWDANRQKWAAQIKVDGLPKYLGRFATPIEAAQAYDTAVKKHHDPEFRKLNFT